LLSDVCSALSLLHSRRLVHRDVTPRNIRRTPDGKAKLIDFGAMVPFGTHKRVVGTPSFTAPEVLTGQALDGRADLFALGATAYYALTGQHAYPARTFANLRNAWRSQPPLPSRYAPDIPPALDQLVLSLLNLAPSRRPASAGAVIERLTAIAGFQLEEQLEVQRAFLATPSLVGRDAALQHIRRHMMRAAHGRGTTIFITGPRGVGRSRMVDACVLEAKLASALVLRCDAADGRTGDFDSARALLEQLAMELPDRVDELLRPHAEVIAHLWPPAAALDSAPQTSIDHQVLRPKLQQALLALLLDVTRESFLVLASDDIDRIDEPTRALIALLADHASRRRMAVVAAADREAVDADERGLSLLRQGELVELEPLSLEHSERLLLSVFGDVANVRLLASRLHEVSGGLPAETMQLAQYLLDRDLIRFRDGGWLLPSNVDGDALPANVSAALRARLDGLDDSTLMLAQAIALSGKSAVSAQECGRWLDESDWAVVLRRLDALIMAQVLRLAADGYGLAQRRWAQLVLADIEPARKQALHARIAETFARQLRGEYDAAAHLLAAGKPSAAVDMLLAHAQNRVQGLHANPASLPEYVLSLPATWRDTLQAAIAAAEQLGRPRHERLILNRLQLQCMAVGAELRPDVAHAVIEQLYGDSGLRDYEALVDIAAPNERLMHALRRAQARYDQTPEAERGLPPSEAIPALTQAIAEIIGMCGVSGDLAFLQAQPSLAPLAPLSPAIAAVQRNIESTCELFAGRLAQAREGYLEILARMAAPGGIGLHASVHRYMELAITYATALVEAGCGLNTAADRLDIIERDPLFEVNAWRSRMLQALRRGDLDSAAVCDRKSERLRIRNAPVQFFDGGGVWHEAVAYAETSDVARLHETVERLDAMGARFPAWAPGAMFARGQMLLLRGSAQAAAEIFEQALAGCAAGKVLTWAAIARGYLTALGECGRVHDARERGAILLREARDAGLTVQIADLHFAMATVELAGGDCDAALHHLRSVADIRETWPIGEVFGGACHELAARVALAQGNRGSFQAAVRACAKAFLSSGNPMLIARHQRLLQDAERAGMQLPAAAPRETADDGDGTTAASNTGQGTFGQAFADCSSADQRIARVLSLALGHGSGQQHAMLYLLRDGVAKLVAQRGTCPETARMDALVSEFLRGEVEGANRSGIDPDDLITSTIDDTDWVGPSGVRFAPALLAHEVLDGLAITGVLIFDIEAQDHPRDSLLADLSAALAAAGDVTPLRVEPTRRA
jgi:hypothetical protein